MTEPEVEQTLSATSRVMSWEQMASFADPLLVLNEEKDYAVQAVEAEVERLGLTSRSMDITVEISVRMWAS